MPPDDLHALLASVGQQEVLRFWHALDESGRAELRNEISNLDLPLIAKLGRYVKAPPPATPTGDLAPPRVIWSGDRDPRAIDAGARLLEQGRVAMVLVAGGQATRLGFDLPKGCFPIGPVSGRSLFEIHAARIAAIGRRTGRVPLWFIMTSPANHEATQEFFVKNRHFGLPKDRIVFFPQATVPAFDRDGRLALETPSRLFKNPNGHGGSLWALSSSGFLDRCMAEGVEHLYYWQVDNPLARIGDPLFLGLHHLDPESGMSTKIVKKRDAGEKVGVLARRNGRTLCVEYSDLPVDLRDARNDGGELLFRAGNIAIHALRVDFVKSLTRGGLRLPWHRAEKKIQMLDADGARVEAPGIKFETFIFDALPLSESSVTLEALREDEFAPVKNREGEDSPATSRSAINSYYSRWFRKAGIAIPMDPAGAPAIEVNPMFAFDYAEFQQKLSHPGVAIPRDGSGPVYLQ